MGSGGVEPSVGSHVQILMAHAVDQHAGIPARRRCVFLHRVLRGSRTADQELASVGIEVDAARAVGVFVPAWPDGDKRAGVAVVFPDVVAGIIGDQQFAASPGRGEHGDNYRGGENSNSRTIRDDFTQNKHDTASLSHEPANRRQRPAAEARQPKNDESPFQPTRRMRNEADDDTTHRPTLMSHDCSTKVHHLKGFSNITCGILKEYCSMRRERSFRIRGESMSKADPDRSQIRCVYLEAPLHFPVD